MLLHYGSTCTVGCMYSFLPALTPILGLITCTQRNTTPYVVVSGVELISDTFTVFVMTFLSVSTEFLQDATPVLFVCPVLFSVSIGLRPVLTGFDDLQNKPHVKIFPTVCKSNALRKS